MPEMSTEFEVYCATCGAGLCNDTDVQPAGYHTCARINVRACEKCVERAHDEGQEEGDEEGYKRGYEEGLADGKEE